MGTIMGIVLIVVFVFVFAMRIYYDWMSRIDEVKTIQKKISKELEGRK